MLNELVDDSVNGRYATEARDRVRGIGPRIINVPHVPWWKKYFRWEALTVAGRTIEKGWVVPQPLGIALLIVILGGVGGLYWRIIDKQVETDRIFTQKLDKQNELLIRLDQALIDKEKHDAERIEEIQKRFQNSDAMDMVMNRDIQSIKAKVGVK